jgi:hypothetical protein
LPFKCNLQRYTTDNVLTPAGVSALFDLENKSQGGGLYKLR